MAMNIYWLVFCCIHVYGSYACAKEEVHDIQGTMMYLVDVVTKIQQSVSNLEKRVRQIEEENEAQRQYSVRYKFNTFGCLSEVISLSCDEGKLIQTHSARYGKYNKPCDDQCCIPHAGLDCYESVEESRPQDWLALQHLCDNQTSCQYEYLGSVIESCETGYIADYISIYYSCQPDNTSEQVGFTVCHLDGAKEYTVDDVIKFEIIQSNIGGGFQPNTHIFICPRDGIFMFAVSVQAGQGKSVTLRIMKNDIRLVQVFADGVPEFYGHSSNFVIIECNKYDQVYVDANADSAIHGFYCRTTFSGFLLHSF